MKWNRLFRKITPWVGNTFEKLSIYTQSKVQHTETLNKLNTAVPEVHMVLPVEY